MFHARRSAGSAQPVSPEAQAPRTGSPDEPRLEEPASERGIYLLVIQGSTASSPIIQQAASRFGLRAYVLMGSVGESAEGRKGELVMEFIGLARDVDGAVGWLEERGAKIGRLSSAR